MSDANATDQTPEVTETVTEGADATAEVTETEALEAGIEKTEAALETDAVVTENEAEEAQAEEQAEEAVAEQAEVDPYAEFKRELRMKPGKWFVIHTYAGFERRVKANLEQRIENQADHGGEDVYQVEVPMEDVVEIKNGQRKMVTRVRVPGYVLVRMRKTEDSWALVRHTPGVTGFVGNAYDPVPLRFKEAFEMLKSLVKLTPAGTVEPAATASSEGAKRGPQTEVDFEIGETITIKEGSFEGLTGTISEIKPESGKLTVLISFFERETPVELSFDQVTKL